MCYLYSDPDRINHIGIRNDWCIGWNKNKCDRDIEKKSFAVLARVFSCKQGAYKKIIINNTKFRMNITGAKQ